MTFIMFLLVALLFYKFVKREHKIVFFKVVGTIVVLGIVLGLIGNLFEVKQKHEEKNKVEVFFLDFKDLKWTQSITLRICNNYKKPMLKSKVHISGQHKGRSSKFSLDPNRAYLDYTVLESDSIIAPKTCTDISWGGKFRKFDQYVIDYKYYNFEWEY